MIVSNRLDSKQLRDISITDAKEQVKKLKRQPIYLILENIYDTYNIGGLFRLADALAVEKIFLCGETETPPNHKILKASVGTYKVVPWEYCPSAIVAIEKLRNTAIYDLRFTIHESKIIHPKSKINIVAIEQSKDSVPYRKVDYQMPLALVVGNETFGVSPETLKAVDKIVEIPMWGINKSLNVIVSAGIVAYHAISQNV